MTSPADGGLSVEGVVAEQSFADEVMGIAAATLHASYMDDETQRDAQLRRLAQRGHDLSMRLRLAARLVTPEPLAERVAGLADRNEQRAIKATVLASQRSGDRRDGLLKFAAEQRGHAADLRALLAEEER